MRTKQAKTHLPTLAAVLLLSVGFILIGSTAAPQASAQSETALSACSER